MLARRLTSLSCVSSRHLGHQLLPIISSNTWIPRNLIAFKHVGKGPAQTGHRNWLSQASSGFSHIDPASNNPTMVNVSDKKVTHRTARACAMMRMPKDIMDLIDSGGEIRSKKGPVFATAVIAGTMAAKKTHDLIPFCHPLGIEACKIHISIESASMIKILCDVRVTGKTGVEMEALTGASVAALAVYDMCKGVSHDMEIMSTKLIEKTGGKSDINAEG